MLRRGDDRSEKSSTESRRRLSSGYGSLSPSSRARSPYRNSSSFTSLHKQRRRSRDRYHPSSRNDDREEKNREGDHRHRSRAHSKGDLRDRLDRSRRRRRSHSSHHRHREDREKRSIHKRIIHGSGKVQFMDEKWATVLCSRKNRVVLFSPEDFPDYSIGDRVRVDASYVHRSDRPPCHADVRYHAFKLEKKHAERDRKRKRSSSVAEDDEGKKVDFILDTVPITSDSHVYKKQTSRSVEYDDGKSLKVVLDNSESAMALPRPRMSSAYREWRSKRFEPTVALKNRKGVIQMEGKWPIICDGTHGYRVSLFPERLGDGRVAPRDGMFVRYDAHLSAWEKLRCSYNALWAEEISQEKYNEFELFTKLSSAASARPRSPYRRRSAPFVSRNEGEIVPGLEGVQGAPRIQMSKEYRLARAFREINKMRPDRQSINHECASLFERGGVWDKFKTVVGVDSNGEIDQPNGQLSSSDGLQNIEGAETDADRTECDVTSPPSEDNSNVPEEYSDDAVESSDDDDAASSVVDVDDVGFVVYDDEEQRLELEAYERLLKEEKARKMQLDVDEEPMDLS
uniref:Uncharacterized protein n=1 Tax=Plectus sambesii TaxID=2011161 RepID=A0A914X2Z3_9BILA